MVRVEIVETLVGAALAGMNTVAEDATGAEVTSAGFTLMARLLSVAMETKDKDVHAMLRDGVQQLMMRCADPSTLN